MEAQAEGILMLKVISGWGLSDREQKEDRVIARQSEGLSEVLEVRMTTIHI